MTVRIICPQCHGEGKILHEVYAGGSSDVDHHDTCDICKNRPDLDGICRVFESVWEKWLAHPHMNSCRRLAVIR